MQFMLLVVIGATSAQAFGTSYGASIGDRVWLDTNSDGIQDADEVGAENVTVFLYNCYSRRFTARTLTDGSGGYTFSNLYPSKYKVFIAPEFDNPDYEGAVISPAFAGAADVDSNATSTGESSYWGTYASTDCGYVSYRETVTSWDIGFFAPLVFTGPKAEDDFYTLSLSDVVTANVTANDDLGDNQCAVGTVVTQTSGSLPNGIELGADGSLSGIAKQLGRFQIGYQLTDCNNETSTAVVEFVVTTDAVYCGVSAQPGDFNQLNGGMSFNIPGISESLDFVPEATVISNSANGDLRVSGTLSDSTQEFSVDFIFSDIFYNNENPRLDLDAAAYVDQNGSIDPADWTYYATVSGTMTGLSGEFEGVSFEPSIASNPAAQYGIGANGQNTNLGFSALLDFTAEITESNNKGKNSKKTYYSKKGYNSKYTKGKSSKYTKEN